MPTLQELERIQKKLISAFEGEPLARHFMLVLFTPIDAESFGAVFSSTDDHSRILHVARSMVKFYENGIPLDPPSAN